MPRGVRAEETEALVWAFILDYLKDPERLRAGLEKYIEEERRAVRGDPEREAKAWLDRIAEVAQERRGYLRLVAKGRITEEDLDEALMELQEASRREERELETLRTRTERLANLELEAEALLEHYAGMTHEGLEAYTPQDKHVAYQALRLRVVAYPDGRMEADGVFSLDPGLCNSELAPA